MNRRTRVLLVAYILLSLGLTGGVVAVLNRPIVNRTGMPIVRPTPDGPVVVYSHEFRIYGLPVPFEVQRQRTDAAGNVISCVHSGRNYPLAVCLILLAWTAAPVFWWATGWLRRPRSADGRFRRARHLVWVAFAAGVGGLAAAWVPMHAEGWPQFILSRLSVRLPPSVAEADRRVQGMLREWYQAAGFSYKDWPTYSRLTAAGMCAGLAMAVGPIWLSTRRAKRQPA